MPKYIDADNCKEILENARKQEANKHNTVYEALISVIFTFASNIAIELLDQMSASDVEPVVHSHWVKLGESDYKCPRCGFRFTSGDNISCFPYCRCGAKMDESKEG